MKLLSRKLLSVVGLAILAINFQCLYQFERFSVAGICDSGRQTRD